MNYIDTKTLEYPLLERDIRERNSDVIFPALNWTKETVAHFGYAPVQKTSKSSVGLFYKHVEGTPELIDGDWYQTWISTELTSAEKQDMFEQAKASKRHLVNLTRDEKESHVAMTPFGLVDTNDRSAKRLSGIRSLALESILLGSPWVVQNWTMADNSTYSLGTAQEAMDMTSAVISYTAVLHAHATGLKAQMDALVWDEDKAEALFKDLDKIEVVYSWPELSLYDAVIVE